MKIQAMRKINRVCPHPADLLECVSKELPATRGTAIGSYT